jgi:hypothetical protein
MRERVRKMQRIMQAQKRLHQLEELKLVRLEREEARLQGEQESLIQSLNEEGALHGLFVDAMARRLTALAREAGAVNLAQEAQSRRVLEEALRLKRSERITGKLSRQHRTAVEKKVFEDILDGIARRDDASPR